MATVLPTSEVSSHKDEALRSDGKESAANVHRRQRESPPLRYAQLFETASRRPFANARNRSRRIAGDDFAIAHDELEGPLNRRLMGGAPFLGNLGHALRSYFE